MFCLVTFQIVFSFATVYSPDCRTWNLSGWVPGVQVTPFKMHYIGYVASSLYVLMHVGSMATAFLLVLYLSTLLYFCFRDRKNEYSAQRGWRPLANMYQSRNQRIYRKISKKRNEAAYAEAWIGKLLYVKIQHAVQHLWGREHFNVRREVLLWGFV